MKPEEKEWTDPEFEEYLDEFYDDGIQLFGMTYAVGRIIRYSDPIAFRCMKADCMRWSCSACGTVYDDFDDADRCCADAEESEIEESETAENE